MFPGPMFPGSYVPHFVCDRGTLDPVSKSFSRRMVELSTAFFASDSTVIGRMALLRLFMVRFRFRVNPHPNHNPKPDPNPLHPGNIGPGEQREDPHGTSFPVIARLNS